VQDLVEFVGHGFSVERGQACDRRIVRADANASEMLFGVNQAALVLPFFASGAKNKPNLDDVSCGLMPRRASGGII
jgi:hypothetical protein